MTEPSPLAERAPAPSATPASTDKFAFLESAAQPSAAPERAEHEAQLSLHSALRRLSPPARDLAKAAPSGPRDAASGRVSKGPFGLILVALVLLAPLPVGLNRPHLWAIGATVLGLFGVVYMGRMSWGGRALAPGLRQFWPLMALALLQPLWALVQALPLGSFAGALSLPVALPPALHPATISLDPNASLLGAMRLVGHILFFLLALDLMTRPERVMQVMRWLFWGMVGWAVYGMVALTVLGDLSLWGEKTQYQAFATGPFVNRNSFAAFLGMGAVLGVARLYELRAQPRLRRERRHGFLTETGLRRLMHVAGLALIVVALLSTGSRMGVAASLVAMGVTALILRRTLPQTDAAARGAQLPKGLIAVFVVAALAGVAVVFGQQLAERAIFTEGDSVARMQIYAVALDLIATRPLIGFGLDAFPLAFELARPDTFVTAFTYADAHSSYLENWAEGGLIFGSVPLAVGAIYARRLLVALRAGGRTAAASAAAAGVLSLALLHSLVDFPFEIEANLLLLCLICAMGVAADPPRPDTPRPNTPRPNTPRTEAV